MATLYTNFISGTLSAGINNTDTTISSSVFSSLPEVSGGDVMYLVLDPGESAGAPEIVTVTAHTAAATSVTVTRGSQGSSARSHLSGVTVQNAVTKADLDSFLYGAADEVATAQIQDSAVTTAKINDLAVTTAKLGADAVTGAKIADDQVDSEHYVAGSIDTEHLGDLQVTTAKLAADAVDGSKLADNAVDSEHYTDGSIDLEHLADALVEVLVPAGTIRMTINASEESGWLNHNQSVASADSTYPTLWAKVPVSWKSGTTLNIPDLTDVAFIGAGSVASLGATGGSNTATLIEANLPSHAHTINHGHSDTFVIADDTHNHSTNTYISSTSAGTGGNEKLTRNFGSGPINSAQDTHTHTLNGAVTDHSGDSGPVGSGTAFSIVSESLGVNVQIKAH